MTETDRSVSELMRELSEQTTTLVRQELELAKLEMAEKGKRAGLGVGMFGGAGVVGLYAVGALTACLVLALATAMEAWLAALIVAAVYAARGRGARPVRQVQGAEAVAACPGTSNREREGGRGMDEGQGTAGRN